VKYESSNTANVPSPLDIAEEIFIMQDGFDACCLEVFRFQSVYNPIYSAYLTGLNIDCQDVLSVEEIPFLPVELFKTHKILCEGFKPKQVFSSSGTTGTLQSKHYVALPSLYVESFRRCFSLFYGEIKDYCVLALLPSYLEREGSSLVFMAQDLINRSGHPESGFYLHNPEELHKQLLKLEKAGQKTLLLGVTYALLDFAEANSMKLNHTMIMETGGMKGRRKELVREELHEILCSKLGVDTIHSEYGMTELLSQAYSQGNGIFHCPPWMKIRARDTNDPLTAVGIGKTGGMNVIDLANLFSCSFIATQDLGKVYKDGSFEIIGRFDSSDVRGCNLMVL
jgi:hypothetical protein